MKEKTQPSKSIKSFQEELDDQELQENYDISLIRLSE